MGRKRHWRKDAQAALEERARLGDPKAIKLLEASFGAAVAPARPAGVAETKLLAVASVTMPWFETNLEPPADRDELVASWHLLRNRVRYLEHQKAALDRELGRLRTGGPTIRGEAPPADPTNEAYRCPRCGAEHVRSIEPGRSGWTCPCGGHAGAPFRRF